MDAESRTECPVGVALRDLRQVAGLTLDEVSELADTAPVFLARVESGERTPSGRYVARVAKAIALSMVAATSVRAA